MTKTHSIGPPFYPSGCLTQAAMKGYVEGTLPEKDRTSIEEHLASCSLCRDAMEGLSAMKDPGKFARDVTSLNKRILQSLGSAPPSRPRHVTKKIARIRTWTYAATAAVVILFIGAYFLVQQARRANQPADLVTVTDTSQQVSGPISLTQPLTEGAENQLYEETMPARDDTFKIDRKPEVSSSPSGKETAEPEIALVSTPGPDESATVSEKKAEETIITENILDQEAQYPESQGQDIFRGKEIGGVVAGSDKVLKTAIHKSLGQDKEAIFTMAEQMPQFPGGDDSLAAYIRRNLQYPLQAVTSQTEGTVYVAFVINKTGIPEDAFILRGIGSGCDEEALRLVNAMPPWIPGTQRGKPVRVQYTLPIRFNIPE